MTSEEKNRVLKMRASGMGYKMISKETGLSVSTIASFCKRPGGDTGENCLQCGAKLTNIPHKKRKKFCSDRCRMLWWHSHPDRINKQAYYHLICQHCGKEFLSYGNDHRKYCSRECYAEHRRKG